MILEVNGQVSLHVVCQEHFAQIASLMEYNRDFLFEHMGELNCSLDDMVKRYSGAEDSFVGNRTLIALIKYGGNNAGMIECYDRTGGTVSGVEVGYWLSKDYLGRGIITISIRYLVSYFFKNWPVNRVFMGIATNNFPSLAVASRLEADGFEVEGVLRENDKISGQWVSHCLYCVTRNGWLSHQ